MLQEIDIELEVLKVEMNTPRSVSAPNPKGPELERLLRYEASLERALDRTIAQLERRQRIRSERSGINTHAKTFGSPRGPEYHQAYASTNVRKTLDTAATTEMPPSARRSCSGCCW